MNAAAIARIAAWNVIADKELPVGTKIIVEDGWVTIHPRGGSPARTPYGPADTLETLYDAIKNSGQVAARKEH